LEKHKTDSEIVMDTLNGSVREFEKIIERYSKKLYLFIFNRTHNREDAEDIVQETFLKAYKNLSSYNPGWKFSTWIYTIASRTSVSHFRYTSVRNREPIIPQTPSPTPEEESLKADVHYVWKAAEKLHPVKKEIIQLRYGEGLTMDEIGKITGKSTINVRVILYRAKNDLIRIINNPDGISTTLQNNPKKSMT